MSNIKNDAIQLVPENVLIDGKRISYGRHGKGDPVVLLHGTPSSSFIWRNIVPKLVRKGHKVHLYDLLGYGLSERPWDTEVDTSVTGQVPILLRLLDFWGLEQINLVAHDIGGAIAQRLSIFEPGLIRTLTLIDTVSFDSWPSERTKQQMRDGFEALIKKQDAEHRKHFEEWIYSTVENKQHLCESSLVTYIGYISGAVGQGSFFQHQVKHYDPGHTLEISDRLIELGTLPVQIIWGGDDAWQVVAWAYKLHDAIPNSELHIIPECGHFAMEDKPEEIGRLIDSFVGNHA